MSAHDPYAPKSKVGPHRVYVEPPPDPADHVPGHPEDILAFLREPGADHAERSRRVDLVEEVEHARPGRMRSIILTAVAWNRGVITGATADGDESWEAAMRQALAQAGSIQDAPTEPDEQSTEAPEAEEPADEAGPQDAPTDEAEVAPTPRYASDDVPKNAADVIVWIQSAADEADAAERSQAAWLVELARPEMRTTVKAEIDKHLDDEE